MIARGSLDLAHHLSHGFEVATGQHQLLKDKVCLRKVPLDEDTFNAFPTQASDALSNCIPPCSVSPDNDDSGASF